MNDSYAIEDPFYTATGRPSIISPGGIMGPNTKSFSMTTDSKEESSNYNEEEYGKYKRYFLYKGWKFPLDFDLASEISKKYDINWKNPKDAIKKIADIIDNVFRKYVMMIDEKEYSICTLFVLFTFFHNHFDYSPRIIIAGTTSSGKTRLQEIFSELCYRCEKITISSYASSYRSIDEFHMTVIVDEAQDIYRDHKVDLKSQIKDGFQRNNPVKKVNPTTFETELFDQFTPMIVSTKNIKIFPEDVINRSFVLKMVENSERNKIKKIIDKTELAEIRTLLYWMKYSFESEKYHNSLKIDEFVCDSKIQLAGDYDSNGIFHYGPNSGIPDFFPELINRPFDIACSFYPFARLIGKTEDLLMILNKSDSRNKRKLKDSDCHTIIDVWVELIMKKKPKTLDKFIDISHQISTKDICQRLNEVQIISGNFIKGRDEVTAREIRDPLESMGFELDYGTNNKTYAVGSSNYRIIFETNLKKYASDDTKMIYQKLTESLTDSNCNGDPEHIHDEEKVSKLDHTRKGDDSV